MFMYLGNVQVYRIHVIRTSMRYYGNENFGRLFIVSGNRGIEIARRLKLRN